MAGDIKIKEESEYLAFLSQFSQQEKTANRQDPDVERELRKSAQAGLSKARMLEKTFVNYRTIAENEGNKKDIEFFDGKIKHIQEHIKVWTSKCQLYGSSLSGLPTTTFDDIVGLDDVKDSIRDYLYVLKNPDVATDYRIGTNLGILLYGPPGTGKTMFGEAIANELGVRFFVITPSKVFGAYVGESEKNIQDLFDELRACTDGSVLLIDECESIFGRRTGDSNRAMLGVSNQLLQEMNGQGDIASSKRVIVGATNRPEMIDEAYLRYKRFSMQYLIDVPNEEAKTLIVNKKLGKMNGTVSPQFKQDMLNYVLSQRYITCADISGIIEQCSFLAVQDMRLLEQSRKDMHSTDAKVAERARIVNERLMNTCRLAPNGRVMLSPSHLQRVKEKYTLSVSPALAQTYRDFRDKHKQG